MTFSRTPVLLMTFDYSDFKFPYDYEKDEETRKLKPLDGYEGDDWSDLMTHIMWVKYQEWLPPPANS